MDPSSKKLGILMLDYPDLPFALGDVGNRNSFPCPVFMERVPGLTFEMCQRGDLTDSLRLSL